jgi:hypothetical protein
MEGLGVDLGKLRAAAGNIGLPTSNPSVDDPTLRSAVADTAVEFGKGFVKGVGDTAGGIVNSPGAQFVSGQIDPLGTLAGRAVDAVATGDPSKLAPPNPFAGVGNVDPNDPAQVQRARAQLQSLQDTGLALLNKDDPFALAKAAPAVADVLVNGDPNQVGQGAGKVFVLGVGAAAGGIAEAGIAAEAGAGEAGAAGTAGAPEAAPVSNPALDAPASSAADSNPFAGPFGSPVGAEGGPQLQLPPDLPPVSAPTSGPLTPRIVDAPAPVSGFDPALQNLPAEPAPPSGPGIDLTPLSKFPGVDDPPAPPAPLPPGEGAGFPFGVDPPSTPSS